MTLQKTIPIFIFLFSSLLLILVVWQRCEWVFAQSFPPSNNSYFYLVEFRSLIEGGQSYYNQRSPFYTVLSLFAQLCQWDERKLFDYCVLGTAGMLSLALCLFAFSKKCCFQLPLIASIPWASDIIFFRCNVFLKQYFSLALLLVCLAILLRSEQKLFSGKGVIFFFLSLFAMSMHLYTFALGLFVFLGKVSLKKFRVILYILSAALVVLLSTLFNKTIFEIPFQLLPPPYEALYKGGQENVSVLLEILIFSLSFVIIGLYVFLSRQSALAWRRFTLLTASMILPIWDRGSEMAARLFFSFFLLAPFSVVWPAGKVIHPLLKSALPILLLGNYFFLRTDFHPRPSAYSLVPSFNDELNAWIPEGSFIRAPTGMQFALSYHLGVSSAERMLFDKVYSAYFSLRAYQARDASCERLLSGVFPSSAVRCVRAGRSLVLYRDE